MTHILKFASVTTSWLVLMKDPLLIQHGGHLGYEDQFERSYVWDSTVAHSKEILPGHGLAIWNGTSLLGLAVIHKISISIGIKTRFRCVFCNSTKIRERETLAPKYRCQLRSCQQESDTRLQEQIDVVQYVAEFDNNWKRANLELSPTEVREIARQKNSQQSMRPIPSENWGSLVRAIFLEKSS